MFYFIQNNFSELRTNRELKCLGELYILWYICGIHNNLGEKSTRRKIWKVFVLYYWILANKVVSKYRAGVCIRY